MMEKDRLGAFIDAVEKISQKTVWSAIVTKLIADAFFNKAMQGLYGVVVLLITFSVLGYYKQLDGKSKEYKDRLMLHKQKWIWIDVVLKVCGLLLSITVFPPATSIAVLVTLLVLVIPNQLKQSE